jgi:hypothetical protein
MADSKITALGSIGTGTDPANDQLVIVDVSDVLPTGMATTGTTKRVGLNQLLSSSPTATGAFSVTGLLTAGSSTITGDLTVKTNVLKVDTTNNRVGFGTATPAVICDVTAIEADIAIFRSTTAGGNDKRLTITSGGDRIVLNVSDNTNTATARAYVFQSAGTEVGRINTTGVYVLKGGTTTASGVGVAFPATQVASSDANCLDDYKEGTWTPVLTFATPGTLVTTYNVQSGTFTKVGRLVTVMFRLSFAAAGIVKGTASGGLSITGLPYTVGSSLSYQYVDLGSTIADITTGSLALMVASGTALSFETVSTSGTRIQRDAASLTAAAFAASNASFITMSGTFTYTV